MFEWALVQRQLLRDASSERHLHEAPDLRNGLQRRFQPAAVGGTLTNGRSRIEEILAAREVAAGLWSIFYPWLLLTPLAAGVVGVALGGRAALGSLRTWAVLLFLGSAYSLVSVLDDFYDWGLDASHKEARPLPRGQLTGFDVRFLYVALAAVALFLSVSLGGMLPLFFAVYFTASFLYSHHRTRFSDKSWLGNVSFIALTVPVPMVVGLLSTGVLSGADALLVVLGPALFGLGVDIPKDLMGIDRDLGGSRKRLTDSFPSAAVLAASLMCVVAGGAAALAVLFAGAGASQPGALSVALIVTACAAAMLRSIAIFRRHQRGLSSSERFLWPTFSILMLVFFAGMALASTVRGWSWIQ